MEVLEGVLLGPFIVCYNNIKQVMKSLFKALMFAVVVITVTSCAGGSDAKLIVWDGTHTAYYTDQVILEDNTAKFTDVNNNQVIINGNFTISDNKCSVCEESEKE